MLVPVAIIAIFIYFWRDLRKHQKAQRLAEENRKRMLEQAQREWAASRAKRKVYVPPPVSRKNTTQVLHPTTPVNPPRTAPKRARVEPTPPPVPQSNDSLDPLIGAAVGYALGTLLSSSDNDSSASCSRDDDSFRSGGGGDFGGGGASGSWDDSSSSSSSLD